jgi:hypothetical protein
VTLQRRRRTLLVMLAATRFQYPPGGEPEAVRLLRGWLDGWLGIGRIAVGMARQGYDLQLTRYDREGWRATFYPEGRSHSVTAAVGSAWEPSPWRAVQHAAFETLRRLE